MEWLVVALFSIAITFIVVWTQIIQPWLDKESPPPPEPHENIDPPEPPQEPEPSEPKPPPVQLQQEVVTPPPRPEPPPAHRPHDVAAPPPESEPPPVHQPQEATPTSTAPVPAYLGNSNTMEIHDLGNIQPSCQIDRMNEENKVFFDNIEEAVEAMESKGYNGCRWCLSQYHTD